MRTICAWLLFCLAPALLSAEVPSALAIRNARVVTVSGPTLNKATVVIRDGLIEAVGENVAVPADAWVIEGENLTVYPGLFDALGNLGMGDAAPASAAAATTGRRGAATPGPATPASPAANPLAALANATPARGPEDRPGTQSWVRAADLVKPVDRRIESFRSAGYTTAASFPIGGIVSGQGAVISLAGENGGKMVIAPCVGMYETMANMGFTSFPGSLFGTMAYLKQLYLDAERYRQAKEMYAANPAGMRRPEYDRALEGVLETRRVLLPATREVEIARMIKLAGEMKVDPVIYGGHESFRAAAMIKEAGVPMLVSLKWPERARDADPELVDSIRTLELRDKAPSVPAELAKAGVKFAFYSDGQDRPADVMRAVRRAIEAGLSKDAALRAMTLSPAEIFGVSDRLGSIEKGKIANLVIANGDLFDEKTKVQYTVVDGVKFVPVPEADAPTGFGAGRPTGTEQEDLQ